MTGLWSRSSWVSQATNICLWATGKTYFFLISFSAGHPGFHGWETLGYTCQLFLKYRHEIFILGVLGFLKTTRSFPNIPKKSEVFRRRQSATKAETALAFSQSQSSDAYKRELAPVLFTSKRERSQGRYCHLFTLHMVFIPYMGLSSHIFGNCVQQDGNNSHFSIRHEKLVRKREPA